MRTTRRLSGKTGTYASIGTACLLLAGCAAMQPQPERPVVANVSQTETQEAPRAAPASVGDPIVEELVGLVQSNALDELRTTYNGPYGASLLFNADDLNYYVVLFQQRQFWRATRTRDYQQAEKLYRTYMAQTEELAEAAIDRIRLDAENAYMQARIDANSGELATLRRSLDFQRQREREVAAAQERTRQEARALAAQQLAAQQKLKALESTLDELRSQQESLLGSELNPTAASPEGASGIGSPLMPIGQTSLPR